MFYKEKITATLLTPISIPNSKSFLSFSVTAGKSTIVPGRLHPFFEPREPPFSISHCNDPGAVKY